MSGWSTLKGDVGDCVGTSSTRDVDGQRGPSFSLEIAARRRGEKRTPQRNGGGGRETGRWKSEHARKRKRKGRKVFYLLINTPSRHFKQLTGVKLCPRRPLRPGVRRAHRARSGGLGWWGTGTVVGVYLCGSWVSRFRSDYLTSLSSVRMRFSPPYRCSRETSRSALWASAAVPRAPRAAKRFEIWPAPCVHTVQLDRRAQRAMLARHVRFTHCSRY